MKKKLKVREIRVKLHKFQMELLRYSGSNKLTEGYLKKVGYMLMWMRLIPIKKNTLKGWSMPDFGTIFNFTKRGLEDLKEKGNENK